MSAQTTKSLEAVLNFKAASFQMTQNLQWTTHKWSDDGSPKNSCTSNCIGQVQYNLKVQTPLETSTNFCRVDAIARSADRLL